MLKYKQMFPYILGLALAYYGLCFLVLKDGSTGFFVLLMALPFICFMLSFLNARKVGFSFFYMLLAGLLFLPIVYFYFNETALIYVFIYAGVSGLAQIFGHLVHQKS